MQATTNDDRILGDIAEWQRAHLTTTGHYHGSMPFDGYRFGDFVPVDQRYSAMLSHRWAERAQQRTTTPPHTGA